MPTNLTKLYNQLLDLLHHSTQGNLSSFQRVFDRDIKENSNFSLQGRRILPTTATNGEDSMSRLFRHLTTVVTDQKIKTREFESDRSIRLHWIKYHVDNCNTANTLIFNVPDERRIYLLDTIERYLIVFEPLRNTNDLYLLSAYPLEKGSYRSIMNKYERRGKKGLI